MGDLQRLYEEGMGRYLIQYINKAVLCGDGIVTLDRLGVTQMAMLSASKLGLEGRPDYFDKLAVPWTHYEHVFWGEDGKISKKGIKLEEKQVVAASHAISKNAPLPPKPSSSCPREGYAVMKLVYARMVEEGCKDFAGKYDLDDRVMHKLIKTMKSRRERKKQEDKEYQRRDDAEAREEIKTTNAEEESRADRSAGVWQAAEANQELSEQAASRQRRISRNSPDNENVDALHMVDGAADDQDFKFECSDEAHDAPRVSAEAHKMRRSTSAATSKSGLQNQPGLA